LVVVKYHRLLELPRPNPHIDLRRLQPLPIVYFMAILPFEGLSEQIINDWFQVLSHDKYYPAPWPRNYALDTLTGAAPIQIPASDREEGGA
jgi:hypothetical protein